MTHYSTTWPITRPIRPTIGSLVASIDRDMLTTIAVRLVMLVGAGLASILTTRYLSPSLRGEYFVAYTLAQGIAQFGNFGLHSSNTYLVARRRALAGRLLANSLWLSLLAGAVSSVVVLVAVLAGSSIEPARLWLVPGLGSATLFYLLGANLFVGLKRLGTFNRFQLSSNVCVVVCLSAAAAVGAGPTGFLLAMSIGWMTVSCALLFTLRRETGASLAFSSDVFRASVRYALKAYVATLCGFLVIRGNIFLLTALASAEQVGYYSVAAQLAEVMAIVPQSMALVLFPALITAKSGQFRTMFRHMVVLAALLALGCGAVALGARSLVLALFGPSYMPAVSALRWMLPGVFFLGLTSMPSQYLAAAGFPISVVAVWIGGGIAAAAIGSLLIPVHAGAGAAVAMSVTHAAVFVAILTLSIVHARRCATIGSETSKVTE